MLVCWQEMHNAFNEFHMLSNTQFIENRVLLDDETEGDQNNLNYAELT